jgi:DnaJ-like protein
VTAKKPLGESWESWVESQIRDAMERGEFANLPGAGKPIPDIDEPHDDLWWIRQKLRRENVSYLPPTLEIRRKIEDALDGVARARSEADVRGIVTAINERIVRINSRATDGPPSNVVPLDVETILLTWRAGRRG